MTEQIQPELIVEYAAVSVAQWLTPQTRLPLNVAAFRIGRLADCQLQIDLREISRQHAEIVSDGKRYAVIDLGSMNGTFLNGRAVEPNQRTQLNSGDLIQIATVLVLRFEDAASTVPVVIPQPYLSGRFWLDSARRQVYVNRKPLEPELPAQQFRLIEVLTSLPQRVITRDEIASAVWPEAQGDVSEAMIDNLVARLRQRLAAADPQHNFIETIRGIGYRFRTP